MNLKIPNIFLIITITLSVLLSSCEFQPHEVPETVLSPPEDGVPIRLTLNDYSDTLKIGWKADLQVKITGTNNKIISVEVIFDGQPIYNRIADDGLSFTFHLNPSSYNNGNYNLEFILITETGTGSIAEKVGAEGYLYNISWPVYIDKTMPDGHYDYTIVAVQTEKGIELSWPSFNYPNFSSYKIYRQHPPIQKSAEVIATILDPLDTTFIDTTYWEGQSMMYWLSIKTPAGEPKFNYIWVHTHLTGLNAEWLTSGSVYITWDKARNLSIFDSYYIFTGFDIIDLLSEDFIYDPEQNYITVENTGFGSGLEIYLKFIPMGLSDDDIRLLSHEMIELN